MALLFHPFDGPIFSIEVDSAISAKVKLPFMFLKPMESSRE